MDEKVTHRQHLETKCYVNIIINHWNLIRIRKSHAFFQTENEDKRVTRKYFQNMNVKKSFLSSAIHGSFEQATDLSSLWPTPISNLREAFAYNTQTVAAPPLCAMTEE